MTICSWWHRSRRHNPIIQPQPSSFLKLILRRADNSACIFSLADASKIIGLAPHQCAAIRGSGWKEDLLLKAQYDSECIDTIEDTFVLLFQGDFCLFYICPFTVLNKILIRNIYQSDKRKWIFSLCPHFRWETAHQFTVLYKGRKITEVSQIART